MRRSRAAAVAVGHFGCSVVAAPFIVGAVALRRLRTPREQPRVLLGLTPVINIKYWAKALETQGYEAHTLVYDVFSINELSDFDYTPEVLFPHLSRVPGFRLVRRYLCFFWSLQYDVLVLDFDGGCLRSTPLWRVELPLRRFARQRMIAIPYGRDATDIRLCHHAPTRTVLLQDYPQLASEAPATARRVQHYARWTDWFICGGMMVDFLPRHDTLVASPLALDTGEWRAVPPAPSAAPGALKIVHAPNHRHVKGTASLIEACDALRAEGISIELTLLEGVPNSEVRRAIAGADVVASAFIMGYYELLAIEGMSMGKPVLNYWRPDLLLIYSLYSYAAECPIVDASVESLQDRIRELARDADLRQRLGDAGRAYVERHHSLSAVGAQYAEIVDRVWRGAREVGAAGSDGEVGRSTRGHS